MIKQPIPSVSRADVERVVRRDFPADRATEVLALLGEYGTEASDARVHLAILKLAAGNIESLRTHVGDARFDCRDVLGAAEYPGYMKRWSRIEKLPLKERQQIIDADWSQYCEWLARR
jgi:hypothetical protein